MRRTLEKREMERKHLKQVRFPIIMSDGISIQEIFEGKRWNGQQWRYGIRDMMIAADELRDDLKMIEVNAYKAKVSIRSMLKQVEDFTVCTVCKGKQGKMDGPAGATPQVWLDCEGCDGHGYLFKGKVIDIRPELDAENKTLCAACIYDNINGKYYVVRECDICEAKRTKQNEPSS